MPNHGFDDQWAAQEEVEGFACCERWGWYSMYCGHNPYFFAALLQFYASLCEKSDDPLACLSSEKTIRNIMEKYGMPFSASDEVSSLSSVNSTFLHAIVAHVSDSEGREQIKKEWLPESANCSTHSTVCSRLADGGHYLGICGCSYEPAAGWTSCSRPSCSRATCKSGASCRIFSSITSRAGFKKAYILQVSAC